MGLGMVLGCELSSPAPLAFSGQLKVSEGATKSGQKLQISLAFLRNRSGCLLGSAPGCASPFSATRGCFFPVSFLISFFFFLISTLGGSFTPLCASLRLREPPREPPLGCGPAPAAGREGILASPNPRAGVAPGLCEGFPEGRSSGAGHGGAAELEEPFWDVVRWGFTHRFVWVGLGSAPASSPCCSLRLGPAACLSFPSRGGGDVGLFGVPVQGRPGFPAGVVPLGCSPEECGIKIKGDPTAVPWRGTNRSEGVPTRCCCHRGHQGQLPHASTPLGMGLGPYPSPYISPSLIPSGTELRV